MYRVSNDATIQASVCILNPACSLHFLPSLHFKPNLQSAVCILYCLVYQHMHSFVPDLLFAQGDLPRVLLLCYSLAALERQRGGTASL